MAELLNSIANRDKMYNKGPLVTTEIASTSRMIIDSVDREVGNGFNFSVDMGYELRRSRFIQLKSVIIPKINNVNAGNNTLVIKHILGTSSIITLQPAMYNTTSYSNELTTKINAQFVLDGIADTVTVSFDPILRHFTMTSVGGLAFFIEDSSSIVVFGDTMVPWASEPIANIPSATSITSGIAGMISTRYMIVSSAALTRFDFAASILSSPIKNSAVLGVINVSEIYSPIDFDISVPYKGVIISLPVDSSRINTQNPGDALPRSIDISMQDGYGRQLSTLVDQTSPLSVVLNFEITF